MTRDQELSNELQCYAEDFGIVATLDTVLGALREMEELYADKAMLRSVCFELEEITRSIIQKT